MSSDVIKKIGVVLRPSTPEIKDSYLKLAGIFESYGMEVFLEKDCAKMIGEDGDSFDDICSKVDMLVTLGGDGTLIATVRRSFDYDIPILGVHAGNLGFLADISLDELDSFVAKLTHNKYKIEERSVLEATVIKDSKKVKMYAFNDVVLTRTSVSYMIHIETSVDSKPFNTYYGDGVIISTPSGSTAYNLSSGGPIIYPATDVFVLTPISPHSLTQRSVVLPGEFEIKMKTSEEKALIIIDGQEMHELGLEECVQIKLATKTVKLMHKNEYNYFNVLKEKLNWGK